MKTALLLDIHNLYLATSKKYPGRVINYTSILSALNEQGFDLFYKVAYGRQPEEKVRSFSTMLKKNGFELFFGNTPHNIEMALRAADLVHRSKVECIILGTNYFEAGRILRFARDHGLQTMAMGVEVPDFFNQFSTVWELDENNLQERKKDETAEATE